MVRRVPSSIYSPLRYVHVRGGVGGSPLGRSYAAMCRDVAGLAGRVDGGEILMLYDGPSSIQDESAAYLLRRSRWAGEAGGRAVVRFRWGGPCAVEELAEGAEPPEDAYLVRPWRGPQQSGWAIAWATAVPAAPRPSPPRPLPHTPSRGKMNDHGAGNRIPDRQRQQPRASRLHD